jgi:hypothetical protein
MPTASMKIPFFFINNNQRKPHKLFEMSNETLVKHKKAFLFSLLHFHVEEKSVEKSVAPPEMTTNIK